MLKRVFDILFSFLGLVITFPLFIIIASFILIENGVPVLFKQERVGRFGNKFIILKFRSMTVLKSEEKGLFNAGDSSRITKTGRIIRRAKLDELPQLINVIKGDMSLVGPRPEVEKWINAFPERWAMVHQVKPGITDNSSIFYRSEESLLAGSDDPEKTYKEIILPKKLDLYEDYVVNNSFLGDLKLIFKTIFTVIFK